MILKFTFKTPSTQGIIEKICSRVGEDVGVEVGLSRDLENVYVYVRGEKIEEFSKRLAFELPVSLFLESVRADVVDEFRDDLKREFPDISLPPCPKCLREVKDENSPYYYDIFHHCEVCGYKAKGEKKDFKKIFKELGERVESGIKIQTMNGAFEVGVDFEDADFVVARDLAAVGRYFFSFKNDAKALASIEKPFMKLKTNLNFKKEFGSYNAFWVKLPDCMVLELLFDNTDFPLLAFKQINTPVDLVFDVEVEKPLRAVVSGEDVLVYDGERGVLPKFEKFVKEGVVGKHKEYVALSEGDKSIIKKDNQAGIEAKEIYAGFYGVLSQWELEDKNILGYSFYKDDNKIFLYSKKFGLVDYLDFKFVFDDFEEIFALIRGMNESGKKLVENFAKKREELFLHALNSNISSKRRGIYYLWGLIGILLGLGDDIKSGFDGLFKYANEAMTKKGPRIDYRFDGNNLNPLWAIRTAMSFNLAGVDNYLLSYGVIESFGEFLSNLYEDVNKDIALDGAILVGDMFEGEFFAKVYSYIKKNYPVFIPKALPSSGAVEAFGSLVIASKES